ncbi:hypothetical protein FHG87_002917 [Trinorchestia longiramus]|nr:hypothetical protein FHG87_002917 [Trinorchestia longiramus]
MEELSAASHNSYWLRDEIKMLDDRAGITLWSTEAIDLSRTASTELGGYRGVYLGKLPAGTPVGRTTSLDKGFALLPNKYSSEGRTNRVSHSSPQLVSPPTQHRRITALLPLEQGTTGSGGGSQHNVIPPLSAHHNTSVQNSVVSPSKSFRETDGDSPLYGENEVIEEEFEEEFNEGKLRSGADQRENYVSNVANEEFDGQLRRNDVELVEERGRFIPTKGSSNSLLDDVSGIQALVLSIQALVLSIQALVLSIQALVLSIQALVLSIQALVLSIQALVLSIQALVLTIQAYPL